MRTPPRRSHCSSYDLPAAFPVRFSPWTVDDAPLSLLHAHRHWELGFCHDGGGVFHLHHQVHDFRPGCAVVIPPDCCHFAASNPGLASRWSFLHCDVDALWHSPRPAHLPRQGLLLPPNHDGARLLAMLVARIEQALNGSGQDCWRSLFSALFQVLGEAFPATTPDGPSDDALAPALSIIAANYADELSMADLAAACGVSTATLNRWFHQRFQQSPSAYLMTHRLQRAAGLLRQTALPIAAVAKAVGMPAVSGFQRQFRRLYAASPAQWRRQHESEC